ncbi:MAG: hypothetical protein QM675_11815 [Protaetiibacter sp.]
MRHPTPLALLLTIPLAVGLLAGCSPADDTAKGDDGYLSLSEVQAEYDATIAAFPYELPSGVEFPAQSQQPTQEAVFQKGAGLAQAYQFWECAWMDEYLQQQGADQAAADAALAQLEAGASSTYRTQYVDDPEQVWTQTVLGQAKLGDPSILGDFYQSDCRWYRTETGQ